MIWIILELEEDNLVLSIHKVPFEITWVRDSTAQIMAKFHEQELGKNIMVFNTVKKFEKALIKKILDLETNYIIEIVIFLQQRAITNDCIWRYRPLLNSRKTF